MYSVVSLRTLCEGIMYYVIDKESEERWRERDEFTESKNL